MPVSEPAESRLRVVRGDPTPEELAAVVAVLARRQEPAPQRRPARVGGWADRAAALRRPLAPREGAWRDVGRTQGTRTTAGA